MAKVKNICSILFMLAFFLYTGCSSQAVIVNGVEERDANEIIVLLATKGITAHKIPSSAGAGPGGATKVQLWDIEVPQSQRLEAMDILNEAGLPRRPAETLLNIFGQTGLVPSATGEKVRYEAGLAQQIASTIRKIDGILDANVIISFPPENPLTGKASGPITAAVFVKHNGVLDDPNLHLREKIQRLVAASVAGLSFNNVTVVGIKARESAGPPEVLKTLRQGQQLTNIWSIVMTQASVFRFQTIFLILILVIVLLLLLLIWTLWKFTPLLKRVGFLRLFKISPITVESFEKPKEENLEEPAKEEKKPEVEDKDKKEVT